MTADSAESVAIQDNLDIIFGRLRSKQTYGRTDVYKRIATFCKHLRSVANKVANSQSVRPFKIHLPRVDLKV